jgi:hypothetical protein
MLPKYYQNPMVIFIYILKLIIFNLNFLLVPPPNGVILESPYETISQATKDFIISPIFYNNQWLYSKGDEALELVNLKLNTSHK